MADSTTRERSKSKLILGIAIAGVIIAVLAIFVLRPKQPSGNSMPLPPPRPSVANFSDSLPSLQEFDLFLFDADSFELVRVDAELRLSQEPVERLKQIVNALVNESADSLRNAIPTSTLLHQVYLDDQSTAYLDFSHHLSDSHIGGTTAELLTVSVILQTIQTNFPEKITKVQILIEGQEVDTIAGHIDISQPLSLEEQEN